MKKLHVWGLLIIMAALVCLLPAAAAQTAHTYQFRYDEENGHLAWDPNPNEEIKYSIEFHPEYNSTTVDNWVHFSQLTSSFWNMKDANRSTGWTSIYMPWEAKTYYATLYNNTGDNMNKATALASLTFSLNKIQVSVPAVEIDNSNSSKTLLELAGLTGSFVSRIANGDDGFQCVFRGSDGKNYALNTPVSSLPSNLTLTLQPADTSKSCITNLIDSSQKTMAVTFKGAPSNLNISSFDYANGTATLEWESSGSGAVYQVSTTGEDGSWVAASNETSHTFTGLPSSASEYTFYVRAEGQDRHFSVTHTPMTAAITGDAYPQCRLSVQINNPFGGYSIGWYLDGILQDETGAVFTVPEDALGKTVQAVVTDEAGSVSAEPVTITSIPAVTLEWIEEGKELQISGLSNLPTLGEGTNYSLGMECGGKTVATGGWFAGGGKEDTNAIDVFMSLYENVSGEVKFFLRGYLDGSYITIPGEPLTMNVVPLDLKIPEGIMNTTWEGVPVYHFIDFTGTLGEDVRSRWLAVNPSVAVYLSAYDQDGNLLKTFSSVQDTDCTSLFADPNIAYLMLDSVQFDRHSAAVSKQNKISITHDTMPAMTGLQLDGIHFTWDNVPGATRYIVECNGKSITTSDPRVEDAILTFGISGAANNISFTVQAWNQHFPLTQPTTFTDGNYTALSAAKTLIDLYGSTKQDSRTLLSLLDPRGPHAEKLLSGAMELNMEISSTASGDSLGKVKASMTVGDFLTQHWDKHNNNYKLYLTLTDLQEISGEQRSVAAAGTVVELKLPRLLNYEHQVSIAGLSEINGNGSYAVAGDTLYSDADGSLEIDPNVSVSYQWYLEDAAGLTLNDLAQKTPVFSGEDLELTNDDIGKYVYLTAVYSDNPDQPVFDSPADPVQRQKLELDIDDHRTFFLGSLFVELNNGHEKYKDAVGNDAYTWEFFKTINDPASNTPDKTVQEYPLQITWDDYVNNYNHIRVSVLDPLYQETIYSDFLYTDSISLSGNKIVFNYENETYYVDYSHLSQEDLEKMKELAILLEIDFGKGGGGAGDLGDSYYKAETFDPVLKRSQDYPLGSYVTESGSPGNIRVGYIFGGNTHGSAEDFDVPPRYAMPASLEEAVTLTQSNGEISLTWLKQGYELQIVSGQNVLGAADETVQSLNLNLQNDVEYIVRLRRKASAAEGRFASRWLENRSVLSRYTITYTDGVDDEFIFEDQKSLAAFGQATPAFSGELLRSGYTFHSWSPVWSDTVTEPVTYTARWLTADQYALIVNGGSSASFGYAAGEPVTIQSHADQENTQLKKWVFSPSVQFAQDFSAASDPCTFTMPASDVTAEAEFSYKLSFRQDTAKVWADQAEDFYEAGTKLTFQLLHKAGYNLENISAADANGNPVELQRVSTSVYSITMPASPVTITITAKEQLGYVVTGSKELCGEEFNPTLAANELDENNRKAFTNVPAGTYSLYVFAYGLEDEVYSYGCWAQAPIIFQVDKTTDVTVELLRPLHGGVKVTGDGVTVLNYIVMAGNGDPKVPAWLNGENWKTTSTANRQSLNPEQNTYVFTYKSVPAGDYEFLFNANAGIQSAGSSAEEQIGAHLNEPYTTFGEDVASKNISPEKIRFSIGQCVTADVTVTLTFSMTYGNTPTYRIDLSNQVYAVAVHTAENGTVTANSETASAGDTVTLSIHPDPGFKLLSLTVTDAQGTSIPLTDNTFTMPSSAVTVTPVFVDENVFQVSTVNHTPDLGSIAVNPLSAAANTEIAVELVYPDNVFIRDLYLQAEGDTGTTALTYTSSGNGNGTCTASSSFLMPAANAAVHAAFQVIDLPPVLTAGTSIRTGAADAAVTFTSNEAGEYYYAVAEAGAPEPVLDTTAPGIPCDTAVQTISLTGLAGESAMDVYIAVKDAGGNISTVLKMNIPAYVPPAPPVFTITFDGYANAAAGSMEPQQIPAGQTQKLNPLGFTCDGYRFMGWAAVPAEPLQAVYPDQAEITPDGDMTLYAVWEQEYSLTVTGGAGSGTYIAGEPVTITADPDTQKQQFAFWRFSDESYGSPQAASYTFSMPAHDLQVHSAYRYRLFTAPAANGAVTVLAGGADAAFAADQTRIDVITAPHAGYHLDTLVIEDDNGHTVACQPAGEPGAYHFTMPSSSVTVTASFSPDEISVSYTVTYDANGGSGSMNADTAAEGLLFTLPECGFTAPEGKRFRAWSIGGTEYLPGDQLVFTGDTAVTALWEDIPAAVVLTGIAITAQPARTEYGTGEVFDERGMEVTAAYSNGSTRKVTGYTWTPSGALTAANDTITVSYTENGVTKTAAVAIRVAAPVPGTFSVTVITDGNGTASAAPVLGVQGTEITLTATPHTGYRFREWQVLSGNAAIQNNKFILGTENVEIKAVFEQTSMTHTADITVFGRPNETYANVYAKLMPLGSTVPLHVMQLTPSGGVLPQQFLYHETAPDGLYNLVITATENRTGKTVTITTKIDLQGHNDQHSVYLPESGKSSIVDDNTGTGIIAGNLEKIAAAMQIDNEKGHLEVKLTAARGYDPHTGAADQQLIERKAASEAKAIEKALDIDLSLLQYNEHGRLMHTHDLGDTNTQLMEILIPINTVNRFRNGFAVYRVHNGVLHALPYQGETFEVDIPGGFIRLNVRLCSSYAIAYGEPREVLQILEPESDQTITVCEGEQAVLSIAASHAAAYQWQISYDGGQNWYVLKGANGADYVTGPVTPADQHRRYRCVVTGPNSQAAVSPVFTLEVTKPVVIPQTGDEANIRLWLALCVLSCFSLVGIILHGKKPKAE